MKDSYGWKRKLTLEGAAKMIVVFGLITIAIGSVVVFPGLAHASVESSLQAVQNKLVGTLLPLASICGLIIAGLSFVAGHPNARQHLIYAIVGAIVGFGSESIVAFIRGLIH